MRLILIDSLRENRSNFYPLVLGRPIWELRCGASSLADKLAAKINPDDVAYFVPDYLADYYGTQVERPVNDVTMLAGDDLLLLDPSVKAADFGVAASGPSEIGVNEQGQVLYARISEKDVDGLAAADIEQFVASARAALPNATCKLSCWEYTWDLVLANGEEITSEFAALGQHGLDGDVEEPLAIRGSKKDIYVAPGARIHPMVTLDAEHGPVYISEGAEVHPFSRVEGPCYIGKNSLLLGAKCREGNSIGDYCRVGGEVEESIIHGYSNKYHDGFLGHSYVGEWVNLGALTTNSDLKNDYSNVSVMLDGRRSVDTGSTKVGSLIGDHAKTSIGTLLNTGSYVGAMALIMATGKPLPKHIPSFGWFIEGKVTKGFGKGRLYETAKTAMSRRGCQWTEQTEAMWDAVFEITSPVRKAAIKKGRRRLSM
ncbi:MAG: putative sugar nucleotidyl transferase [Planctomycetota bacterium]|jgi:UDP-N-acetylglucosamine diphosphorylase/glucosamine-1-phosphate N-acetyltransferase